MMSAAVKIVAAWPRFGVTFPFIVGALREPLAAIHPRNFTGADELQFILEQLRDGVPDGKIIILKSCDTISEVVAMISAGEKPLSPSLPVFCASQERDTLYLDERLAQGRTYIDLNAITDMLWGRYGENIIAGRFSKNGAWGAYTTYELDLIRNALNLDID